MATFEDTVAILKSTHNPFDLTHHMTDIVTGMDDLLHRLQALEAKAKSEAPHVPR